MRLDELLEKVSKIDNIEVQMPNRDNLPPNTYYIVRIIRYFPNKSSKDSHVFLWTSKYLTKNPLISNILIQSLKKKLKLKEI